MQYFSVCIYSTSSTSTEYCRPSEKKVLAGVTARVNSKQILERLGKYDGHYDCGKSAHFVEEVSMCLTLCILSTLDVTAKREIYQKTIQLFLERVF